MINNVFICFGIFFIALIVEAVLSWFCFYQDTFDKKDETNVIAILATIAVINAMIISIIAAAYFI